MVGHSFKIGYDLNMKKIKYSVCLLAAGKGSRTQLDYNKVFYKLNDEQTVLDMSIATFKEDEDCSQIILVCAAYEHEYVEGLYGKDPQIIIVDGGATRQESVYNGLQKVTSEYVWIHDGARPFLQKEHMEALKSALQEEDACLLMVPSTDTVKLVQNHYVVQTWDRSQVYRAQTPQCFKTSLIQQCHEKAKEEQRIATDDAQLVEWYSKTPIRVVEGDPGNIKITHPNDLK